MKIEFRSRWTGEVKVTVEANSRKEGLEKAVAENADLRDIDLRDENLVGARLDGARLDSASLVGARLDSAGTLGAACGKSAFDLPLLRPDSERPAERFFMPIRPGDMPENSQFSRLALEWVDQWLANMRAAFGPSEPVATSGPAKS